MKKMPVKKYITEKCRLCKLFEKFTFREWQACWWWFYVLFLVFQQTCWTLLVQTTVCFELLARWMSWFVLLNDRKAAYHVPHRQATDICHLKSFSFSSPRFCLFLPPQHTPMHTRTCTHTVLLALSPHFQSISATYLSHHSNCSQ